MYPAILFALSLTLPGAPGESTLVGHACTVPFQEGSVQQKPLPDVPGSAIFNVRYPTDGSVLVTVDANNVVTDVQVEESLGNSDIDEAAISAAQKATFHSRKIDCMGVPTRFLATFHWSSDDFELSWAQISVADPIPQDRIDQAKAAIALPLTKAQDALRDDAIFGKCKAQSVDLPSESDVQKEFACVYRANDYRAAEVLGEALVDYGTRLNGDDSYWLANALYNRGNASKALPYAQASYSHLKSAQKERCQTDVDHCADLRRLLIEIEPTYRSKFAAEDNVLRAAERQAQAKASEAAREARADAAEAAREAAATAFSDNGSGIHSTEYFHVNGEWELDWSYDCSNVSGSGNFIVEVNGDVNDLLVNELGSGDSGTEYVHAGGDVYLKINSECDWTVKAVNE